MLQNYLEMIQAIDARREALYLSDCVYTYGDLIHFAKERQKQIPETKQRILYVIQTESILEQLIGFLACQGTQAVPLIVPSDISIPKEFFEVDIPEKTCMAVMTSGTTGTGKLLFRTFSSWYDYFKIQNQIFGIGAESRLFMQGSLSFTGNLNLYLAQFSVGAVVIGVEIFDPRSWKAEIEQNRANGIYLIPAKLRALKQIYEREQKKTGRMEPNNQVKLILSGSQSLGGAEARAFRSIFPNADLILYYGASELNYVSYVHGCDMGEDKTLIGRSFPGIKISLHQGEIHVTTPYGVLGTEKNQFIGDYGHWDALGNLYFDGRKDDICNINGRKVSAVRVENAILEVDGVQEVAVGSAKRGNHDMLMAWIVPERSADCAVEDLKKKIYSALRRKLAASEIPQGITLLEKLPKNASGKVQKHKLAENKK